MGILSDIFVSTAEDALSYEAQLRGDVEPAPMRYEVAQYRRLTGLQFGTLWAILEQEQWNVDKHMLRHITHSEAGETWLEEFPTPLVSLLAGLNEQSIVSTAARWGATEELGWPPRDAIPVLEDLRRLSLMSLSSGKGMYLWGSI